MQRQGVVLDVITCSVLTSTCEKGNLLEAMQGLAASITSGSKQLHERMDRLAKETASAYTRLLTTQNHFVQLSNVKFIEARVYEDSEEAVDDQTVDAGESKEEAPSEETLISEALGSGVKLLEAAFEKVEIEDSDSDEEESSTMISVMQPKNPFHIRSLLLVPDFVNGIQKPRLPCGSCFFFGHFYFIILFSP